MTKQPMRTRYAPSPTGHLHIGGARTALFCYLLAKKNKGSFIVRIEDTDVERNVEEAAETQLAGLKWMGIEWDESIDRGGPYGPYRSMERLDIYHSYLEKLQREGHVYPCYCTSEELEADRERQMAQGIAPRYSGRCRQLSEEEKAAFEAEGRKPCYRFKVPSGKIITVKDVVRGEVRFESDGIGDFIIVRPDGRPTYNFAVTIDDALMKITDVIRGEEHLSNTPRQVLIYEALNFPVPNFAHLSLILNQDGKKMSKRDESVVQFVDQYRDLGYLPEALVNFIALLGWAPEGEEELFSKEELIERFSLDRVSKAPAVFDPGKLKWMNNYYIKQSSVERITELAIPHLEAAGKISLPLTPEQETWLKRLVALYQEQLDYVAQIVPLTEIFFREEITYSQEAQEVLKGEQVPEVLAAMYRQIKEADQLDPVEVKGMLKNVQRETGQKGKRLFMPIRAAITGEVSGPELNEAISLLGKEKVLPRLEALINR